MDNLVVIEQKKINKLRYFIFLLFAAAIWGSGFSVAKIALQDLSPLYLIAIRYLLAFAVMAALSGQGLRRISLMELRNGVLAGLLLFSSALCLIVGLQHSQPGKQAFLCGSYVVMLPFLLWAVDRVRPKTRAFLGALVCFSGIGLLSWNGAVGIEAWDCLTLLGAFFLALHMVAVGHLCKNQCSKTMNAVQFGTAAQLGSAAALISGPVPVGIGAASAGALVYLVLFATCGAMFIQVTCQKFLNPTAVSVVLSTETIFGSLFAWLLFGEVFTLRMVAGSIAIFTAMLMSEG